MFPLHVIANFFFKITPKETAGLCAEAACYCTISGYAIILELAFSFAIFLCYLTEGIQDYHVVLHH